MRTDIGHNLLICLFAVLFLSPGQAAAHRIVIDGEFDDWASVADAYVDPTGDAGHTGLDITTIRLANDAEFLYLYIDFGLTFNLQDDHDFLRLCFDTDNNPASGWAVAGTGAELVWKCGQRKGFFVHEGVYSDVYFDDVRLRGGPTFTSRRYELAIGRDSLPDGVHPLFIQAAFTLVIKDDNWAPGTQTADGDTAPEAGETIRYVFDDTPLREYPTVALERNNPEFVRVVTWNTLQDGLFDPQRQPSFRRILQALQPDIICLQEMYDHGPAEVLGLVAPWLPLAEGAWVADGRRLQDEGDMRDQVTLSRFPIRPDWAADCPQPDPDQIKYTATWVEVAPNQPLVVFNAHLKCCNDPDDNIKRQKEADSFIACLRLKMAETMFLPAGTPFLLAGDLNLVGDVRQYVTLWSGDIFYESLYGLDHSPDWDGSGLWPLMPRQTERRMAYTSRDDTSSYWPGRLDYVMYSDSVMVADRHYLVYTPAMNGATLVRYGLLAEDSVTASDHLPLVADFCLDPSGHPVGDFDYDNRPEVVDLMLLQLFLVSDIPPTPLQRLLADLNADGSMDSVDAVLLGRKLADR
ncbi:MAG: endonuclease/exonuclease/phosphatase family protein [Acidobacteria bacterium]|nr:endonuclease/exonuclease/phosphatase family protein [Acidobacteriota bacterium]